MTTPNFFIVGAPKCGTTALAAYLREHPRIFMTRPKEPHFFADDLHRHRAIKTKEEYLALFRGASEEHEALGEASVFYLYSKVAIRNLMAHNPKARLVAMLRNPVDMLHSYHAQMVRAYFEDERDFERALALRERPEAEWSLPPNLRDPALLRYREVIRLGEQVERLLSIVPREQVRFVLIDDLKRDTQGVYEGVLEHIGVPSDGRTEFPRINVNRVYKNESLAGWMRNLPPGLRALRRWSRRLSGHRGTGLGLWVQRLNSRKVRRQTMSPELRRSLAAEFRPDVEKLGELIGRDLSHWQEDTQGGAPAPPRSDDSNRSPVAGKAG